MWPRLGGPNLRSCIWCVEMTYAVNGNIGLDFVQTASLNETFDLARPIQFFLKQRIWRSAHYRFVCKIWQRDSEIKLRVDPSLSNTWTLTHRLSAVWRSIHAIARSMLNVCEISVCTVWTFATAVPPIEEEVFEIGVFESSAADAWSMSTLAILPSARCNEWCMRRQCIHHDLLGHFSVKLPDCRQLKQICFFLARVLCCITDFDRNSSRLLSYAIQLTHFITDTPLTEERDLFREFSNSTRCIHRVGKSAKMKNQKCENLSPYTRRFFRIATF